jgi:cytochrome c556
MASSNADIASLLAQISTRLSNIEAKLATMSAPGGSPGGSAGGDEEVSRQTAEFDGLVSKFGVAFQELSAKLGADAAALVREARPAGRSCPTCAPSLTPAAF